MPGRADGGGEDDCDTANNEAGLQARAAEEEQRQPGCVSRSIRIGEGRRTTATRTGGNTRLSWIVERVSERYSVCESVSVCLCKWSRMKDKLKIGR